MFNRIFIAVLLIFAFVTFSTAAFADTGYIINKPGDIPAFALSKELDGIKTFEQAQVISGRGKEGTKVVLSVYALRPAKEITPIIAKKQNNSSIQKNEEWILQSTQEWTIGASGIFARNVFLVLGKNRLEFKITNAAGVATYKEINMELVDKKELTQFIFSVILNDINRSLYEQ